MSNLPIRDETASVIRLRAHTLLCLQGFRGMGYSPEFVGNMAAVHRALAEHPESVVEILDSPDIVCGACPHRRLAGCTLNGSESEHEMARQDHAVLHRLRLRVGDCISWQHILERIHASIHPDELSVICGNCRWLPLGFCREGIERLQHSPVHPFSNPR
jgi:hypothetical protein